MNKMNKMDKIVGLDCVCMYGVKKVDDKFSEGPVVGYENVCPVNGGRK